MTLIAQADRLQRWGIAWDGPKKPICQLAADGYWTPWHLADAQIQALRYENARLREAMETYGQHRSGCAAISHRRYDDGGVTYNNPSVDCTCGFSALHGSDVGEKAENTSLTSQVPRTATIGPSDKGEA